MSAANWRRAMNSGAGRAAMLTPGAAAAVAVPTPVGVEERNRALTPIFAIFPYCRMPSEVTSLS